MEEFVSIDSQRAYYDDRWARERWANRLQLARAIAILDGLLRLQLSFPRILDFGCGTGWLTVMLGRFGPTTGMDLSASAIEIAQTRHLDVDFVAADCTTLQADNEQFDVVVSQEVIEHIEDQARHVDLLADFLRPGGYLLLTTPNAWNLAHWTRESLQAWGLQPIEQWLTTRRLRSLLDRRFRVLEMRTILPGHGTEGLFRLVNSRKLSKTLEALGLLTLYERALTYAGFGLHIFVV